MLAFSAPSSKQKDPDLLCEKQASDDGFAATQIDNTYWAEFYSKSEMSQWYCTNEFMADPHGSVSLEPRLSRACKDSQTLSPGAAWQFPTVPLWRGRARARIAIFGSGNA